MMLTNETVMNPHNYPVGELPIANCYIGGNFILVTYPDGCGYLFNAIKPGLHIVNQMIELARQDEKPKLAEFIRRNARGDYYQKLV